ncbi:uncharacterized protein LOC131636395 [Vicia villosa]|uniref:uncharacterized protein LOC131636395 n=1 Tax=Vicia villosa TaxID=3911 RepID=UPI00273B4F1B|nr:uncharacterized protein LOC131636395 [Vicia villosa]
MIVGEGTWKHLWAIKTVLKAFEIVSGLGINYHKSKLIGINVRRSFLDAASYFLSCKVEDNKFSFLGILIGCNPRKASTWLPFLSKVKKQLMGWKNRFLNLGGRITLLKAILTPLSIFTMSFYKMPLKVVRDFNLIQSNFLWGGVEEKRKIHWISWKRLMLPFNKGGLGIKNISAFNLALLCKWRWRILKGHESLWFNVLKARYEDLYSFILYGGGGNKIPSSSSFSSWWRDLVKIGSCSFRDPIKECCSFDVHNGFNTPFLGSKVVGRCYFEGFVSGFVSGL